MASDPFGAWVEKYCKDQRGELKPWVHCDDTGEYPYIEVSVKGARHNNEDSSFGDGKLFGVFDGHGGKYASTMLRTSFPEAFRTATKGSPSPTELLQPGQDGTPRVARALDDAFTSAQAQMPTEMPFAQSGSTAVVSWVHGGENDTQVFAACLGDSKALVFNTTTGAIPKCQTNTWDRESGTFKGAGVEGVRKAETLAHNLTGDLVPGTGGKAGSMTEDPDGVGYREFSLLRERFKFPPNRRPYNISNMPGEERWRVLDVEPTRAFGHKLKKEHPMRHPEVFQWRIPKQASDHAMILSCDGFYSKNAFADADNVCHFLADPEGYCKRPDFFSGSCLVSLLEKLKIVHTLPNPTQASMEELFTGIRNVVFSRLSDDTWTSAYQSAFVYLKSFSRERPIPNIKTHPVKTLLAACYLAILMVSDDNVSVSVVFLDKVKRYGGKTVELGTMP
mmetsp:Transcript_52706/g.125509  ORF Transcript_52706/g.125509 Transcript_52706/m.125509 type:complete len:448 (+) Transcript_52706:146-1489(+)